MDTRETRYLPGYDSRTSRLELVAFSGLSLASVLLIAAGVANSLQFARNHDAVLQAWSETGWHAPEPFTSGAAYARTRGAVFQGSGRPSQINALSRTQPELGRSAPMLERNVVAVSPGELLK